MIFEDRLAAHPQRYLLKTASGETSYITLERADDPIREGTPLNANTFNTMLEEIQIASEDHPGCYYRMVDGEEEWINPPMVYGEVYRTSERYNGEPVYTCAIEIPEFSTLILGAISVPFTDWDIDMFDISGWVSLDGNDRKMLPYSSNTYNGEHSYCYVHWNPNDAGLLVEYSDDMAGTFAAVTLKWIHY